MEEPTTDASIEAAGLTKQFGTAVALDGVDLSVAPGESLAVFGANGAGKTTLIRILALTLKPNGGKLRIAGLDPRKHDRRIRRRIGLISHQSFLYDDLTAGQNLELFARLYGVEDPRGRSLELLRTLEMEHRAHDDVGSLSRGLLQRVSLARAVIHDPPIVFLDEPFTGLDPHASDLLRRMLRSLQEAGRTVLLVTHDLPRGLELSDRWLILSRGRIVRQGVSAGTDARDIEPACFELPPLGPRPAPGSPPS